MKRCSSTSHSRLNSTGPGGCPLAQTLIEAGQRVLMIERGDERGPVTDNLRSIPQAFRDICIEKIDDNGVWLPTGNCVGGASSASGGVWIEEDADELLSQMPYTEDQFASVTEIRAAYEWVRDVNESFLENLVPKSSILILSTESQPSRPFTDRRAYRVAS